MTRKIDHRRLGRLRQGQGEIANHIIDEFAAGRLSRRDFIRRAEIGTQHKRGRWLSFLAGADCIAADFAREHGRKVGDIMTPNPITVSEGTPLDEVVQTMQTRSIKRVPVMRGDRLVGILTRTDFLPAVANLASSPMAACGERIGSRTRIVVPWPGVDDTWIEPL